MSVNIFTERRVLLEGCGRTQQSLRHVASTPSTHALYFTKPPLLHEDPSTPDSVRTPPRASLLIGCSSIIKRIEFFFKLANFG